MHKTPVALTAAMLTRITASGTINPAHVPQAPADYKFIGCLFYPNLSECYAMAAKRWGRDISGSHMAGYMAIQCAIKPGGAAVLHDMARLELALNDMQPMAHAQAQAAIVAYMCGAIKQPAHTKPGGEPATFDMCDIWARPMLARTAIATL